MDLPLEIVDRDIARAVASWKEARDALVEGTLVSTANPLEAHRKVSGRATYRDLAEPAPTGASIEPLLLGGGASASFATAHRRALRSWVYTLTLERVLWVDTLRLFEARSRPSIHIDRTDLGRLVLSPRQIIERLLVELDPSRRRLWADALAKGTSATADAARILSERRAEASRLLGEDPTSVEIPCEDPSAVENAAAGFLRSTEPFVHDRHRGFADAIAEGVGHAYGEGWPARLSPRWLEELFRKAKLTEGLRLELGRLPRAIGATSFARALAIFGGALADADGPRQAPFTLAHPPFDLRRARRAALFGGLVADPTFGAQALGLGRSRAREQARGIARALVVSLRLDAVRVLCRDLLLLPERERHLRFEEITGNALGEPIPSSLAGVVPRLSPCDAVSFLGTLLAASDRRALIARYDEDWFRSPHACRALREEDATLPSPSAAFRVSSDTVNAGLGALTAALAELF